MLDVYHLDARLLSDIIEPGPGQSYVISDHLRPDSRDHPQSSGICAEVTFLAGNNDTINL